MITWKMCPFPYAPEVVDKFWQMLGVGQPLPVERWYSETPRHELSSVLVPNRYLMAGHDDCWHVGDVQWWVALDGVVGSCCMLERVGACHPRGVFANAGVWDQQLFGGSDVGRGHRCNRCDRFAAVMCTRLIMHKKGTLKTICLFFSSIWNPRSLRILFLNVISWSQIALFLYKIFPPKNLAQDLGSSVSCLLRFHFVPLRFARNAMPLSQEQIDVLKNPRTVIAYQEENPKAPGTKAWDRYEKYKKATTVAEAKDKKAGWLDLTSDFEKGFLKFVGVEQMDTSGSAVKRPAPEGTPDKEAQARSKSQPVDLVPRVLPTEVPDAISKVEMSAATIATLRMVMREEIASGMQEMENRMMQKMEDQLGQVKAELVAEKEAREALEVRVRQLENSPPTMTESVDKSQVVIGGFEDLDGEEAEKLVSDVLMHADGFQGAHTLSPNPTIAIAQFTTAVNAIWNLFEGKSSTRRCENINCGHQKTERPKNAGDAKSSAKSSGP